MSVRRPRPPGDLGACWGHRRLKSCCGSSLSGAAVALETSPLFSVVGKFITCSAAVSATVSTPLGATGFNEKKLSSGFPFLHLGLLRTFH